MDEIGTIDSIFSLLVDVHAPRTDNGLSTPDGLDSDQQRKFIISPLADDFVCKFTGFEGGNGNFDPG